MTTIQLEYSLKHGEEEINELTFRRATFKDVKSIKLSDLDHFSVIISLSAKLTGKPESIFNNMDLGDILKCSGVIGDFLQNFRKMQENA